jgi:hypothetical protein
MPKPIICPECILNYEKELLKQENTDNTEATTDGLSTGDNVKVFHDWKSYAKHILESHPNSPRVEWVISCVNDEVEKYNGKELPASIKLLKGLIDKGQPQPKVTNETNPQEQDIYTEDENTWKDKLAELHNLAPERPDPNKIPLYKGTKRKPLPTYIIIVATLLSVIIAFISMELKINALGLVFIIMAVIGILLTLRRIGSKPKK